MDPKVADLQVSEKERSLWEGQERPQEQCVCVCGGGQGLRENNSIAGAWAYGSAGRTCQRLITNPCVADGYPWGFTGGSAGK